MSQQFLTPGNKQCQRVSNNFTQVAPTYDKFLQLNHVVCQPTPKPRKKILLYDDEFGKHSFPLLRDKEIGIGQQYQHIVIDSWNDDDRKTTSTQLEKGKSQTLKDLYQIIHQNKNSLKNYKYSSQL